MNCDSCGHAGSDAVFCPRCGAARPALEPDAPLTAAASGDDFGATTMRSSLHQVRLPERTFAKPPVPTVKPVAPPSVTPRPTPVAYNGGVPGMSGPPRRRRSVAWVYYGILAVLSLFAIPSTHGASLVATALCGLYAAYIFRGGRVVIWIW